MFLRLSLRSLVVVSLMDRVSNEEVRRIAGIERELASKSKVFYGQSLPVENLLPQNVGSIIN